MTRTLTILLASLLVASTAAASSLESLEHERATMVSAMLDPAIDSDKRSKILEESKRRLVDLERMVLREDSAIDVQSPTARAAFSNYDLTFLVHGASEQGLTIFDQWFDHVGLTTETVMTSTPRRR